MISVTIQTGDNVDCFYPTRYHRFIVQTANDNIIIQPANDNIIIQPANDNIEVIISPDDKIDIIIHTV